MATSKAEKVLDVDHTFSDEPLEMSKIDGLEDAVRGCYEDGEDRIVRDSEKRFRAYMVYWNAGTETVRVAIAPACATYEPDIETYGGLENHPNAE